MAPDNKNKDAETVKEAIEKPHRATRFRDGIYPITGTVIGVLILVGLVIYFF